MAYSESRVPLQAVPSGVKSLSLQDRAGSWETSFTCTFSGWTTGRPWTALLLIPERLPWVAFMPQLSSLYPGPSPGHFMDFMSLFLESGSHRVTCFGQ